MTLSPRVGQDPRALVAALTGCVERGRSVAHFTATPHVLAADYLTWLRETTRTLHPLVNSIELDRMLGSSTAHHIAGGGRHFAAELIVIEFDARIDAIEAARDDLRSQIRRWVPAGRLVVADTSVFIHHPNRLDEMVLADDLGEGHTPLRLVILIVVVDELDDLKESRGNARHRAQLTLAILDRKLPDGVGPAVLRPETSDPVPRGAVTVEVLLDPVNHVRMPINDDEIIDRALAVQRIAQRSVTLVTYDTGQSTRARAAGLETIKLIRSTIRSRHVILLDPAYPSNSGGSCGGRYWD